ncbi:MAG: hypothetical protein ACI9WU_000223 [Myxococcota bacterium]
MLIAVPASAQDTKKTWAICEFGSRGLEQGDVETFRELLQSEMASRVKGGLLHVSKICQDSADASQVAGEMSADRVIYGTLSTLGRRIVVTVMVADAAGSMVSSDRITIDRVEDLEAVAARMANAVTTGKRIKDTVELGTVTAKEQRAPRRRHGDSGFGVRFGGLVPMGSTHGGAGYGMLFDVSYWYETPNFSIDPRIGFRFDTDTNDNNKFFMFDVDVGVNYIMGLGDFTPFFGGGLGARWVFDERPGVITAGSVISGSHDGQLEDSGWGLGAFARAGVLLFRTWNVRMTLSLEYDITFIDLNDAGFPNSFQFGLGVIF